MKKWKCVVCGYIHEGEEPPEKCPVCGADASKFQEITEEVLPAAEEVLPIAEEAAPEAPAQEAAAEAIPAEAAPAKKWRCTVCNYIHEGPEPPEVCPVCGADKSKFVEVLEDGESMPATETPAPEMEAEPQETIRETYKVEDPPAGSGVPTPEPPSFLEKYEPWLALLTRHHAHPIAVHLPNGVVPLAVVFLILSVLFNSASLAQAYLFNMVAVLLAMPWVLFTGYVDWKRVYHGASTPVFSSKMVCGGIVTATAFILVVWNLLQPDILASGASGRWFFALLNFLMAGAAGYAGFQGGKLVFNK